MEFIDTHAHLDFEYDTGKTVDTIIDDAAKVGVNKIITISSDIKSLDTSTEITKKYDNVYHSLGIHPHDAKDFNTEIEDKIISLKNKKTVAIGEIGLDYYYEYSDKKIQKEVFIRQTEIARKLSLPLIIHVREADKDALEIITSEYNNFCNAVIH